MQILAERLKKWGFNSNISDKIGLKNLIWWNLKLRTKLLQNMKVFLLCRNKVYWKYDLKSSDFILQTYWIWSIVLLTIWKWSCNLSIMAVINYFCVNILIRFLLYIIVMYYQFSIFQFRVCCSIVIFVLNFHLLTVGKIWIFLTLHVFKWQFHCL